MTAPKNVAQQNVFSISGPTKLIENFDEKIIEPLREKTGMKVTRSGLIKLLMQLTLEAADSIDTENIYDEMSLQAALKSAFKEL